MSVRKQEQLFTPDGSSDGLDGWREHIRADEAAAERDGAPRVKITERRESMLRAIDLLASISMRNGLIDKLDADPELASAREARAADYPQGVFDKNVIPGSKSNRRKEVRELETAINGFIGDLEGARRLAWSDLPPEQRVELEIEGKEREELSAGFRAKYMRKEGNKPRQQKRRTLKTDGPKRRAA